MINCYIWGAGWYGKNIREFVIDFDINYNIVGYIDSNPKNKGKEINGKKIYLPEILCEQENVNILICARNRKEIEKIIDEKYSYYNDKIITPDYSEVILDSEFQYKDEPEIMNKVRYLEKIYSKYYFKE